MITFRRLIELCIEWMDPVINLNRLHEKKLQILIP